MSGANGGAWTPYDPLDATLGPARAGDHGPCGDPAGGGGAHEVGGQFYFGGKTVATYTAGGTVDFELAITAHHNGFMEWWVCDVDKCGGADPTGACFATPGACVRLDRVAHPACEAGTESDCGPIQPGYPSRWYLPCKGSAGGIPGTGTPLVFGGSSGKMRYALPAGFSCERCVAQWYWATANSCFPPGVSGYRYPAAWSNCPTDMPTCGAGAPWPEEFWTCSDVTIKAGGGGGGGVPPPAAQPVPQKPPSVEPTQTPPSPPARPPPAQPTWTPPPAAQPVPPPPAPPAAGCMAWGSWCVVEGKSTGSCCAGTSCSPYERSTRFSMCL